MKEGRKIYRYSIDHDGISKPVFLGKLKEDDLDIAKAGNWLFVYTADWDNAYLHFKINVKTGEAIENTVRFDSSQHDEIHVDEKAPQYYGRN